MSKTSFRCYAGMTESCSMEQRPPILGRHFTQFDEGRQVRTAKTYSQGRQDKILRLAREGEAPAEPRSGPRDHQTTDHETSPVVLWSCGPVVLWSRGPVVPWSCGPVVLWSDQGSAGASPSRGQHLQKL